MPDNDFYNPRSLPVEFSRARAGRIGGENLRIQDAFSQLPPKNRLYSGAQLWCRETSVSAANAYKIVSDYPITSYEPGVQVHWIAGHENSGASTISIDGLPDKDLVDIDGNDLVGSEILANRPIHAEYDGTALRLLNSASQVDVSVRLPERVEDIVIQVDVAMTDVTIPAATGGTSPYAYAIAGLPTGLSFNTTTRVISGTPTGTGTTQATLTITDSASPANSITVRFNVAVQSTVLALATPDDLQLTSGSFSTFNLPAAEGGNAPYTYGMNGIPSGLSFDSDSVLRRLFGTPDTPGIFENVEYYVVDDDGTRVSTTFQINVRSNVALSLPGIENREVVSGQDITAIILPEGSGGLPGYAYVLDGLPAGLSFTVATRAISGNTTVNGDHVLSYTVTDQNGTQETVEFTLTVAEQGRRYVGVIDDGGTVTDSTATDGTSQAKNARNLQLPEWDGEKKIVIFQPQSEDDLTYISLSTLGNAISAFTKSATTVTIESVLYEYWVGNDVQGGEAIGGGFINVLPGE